MFDKLQTIISKIESKRVASNLFKAFNDIIALGNETKLTPHGKIPSIAFSGFTISG